MVLPSGPVVCVPRLDRGDRARHSSCDTEQSGPLQPLRRQTPGGLLLAPSSVPTLLPLWGTSACVSVCGGKAQSSRSLWCRHQLEGRMPWSVSQDRSVTSREVHSQRTALGMAVPRRPAQGVGNRDLTRPGWQPGEGASAKLCRDQDGTRSASGRCRLGQGPRVFAGAEVTRCLRRTADSVAGGCSRLQVSSSLSLWQPHAHHRVACPWVACPTPRLYKAVTWDWATQGLVALITSSQVRSPHKAPF